DIFKSAPVTSWEVHTLMTTTAASPRSGTKKRRAKRVKLPYQTVLRYGDVEREAIEAVQAALSTVRGRKVPFAEAIRRLIGDRPSVTEIEARAHLMERSDEPVGPVEIPAATLQLLNDLNRKLGHCQGSLNSVAKQMAYANKGYDVTPTQ